MRRVLGGVEFVSDWSGRVLWVLILLIMVLLLWEITLRYIFNAPTIWAHETCQHIFGAYSVLAGAYVLLYHKHVKVDLLWSRFSPRGRAIIDSFTYLAFFLFIGIVLWQGWLIAWHAVQIMEVSLRPYPIPIYPLKLTVPIAAFMILLQGLAHFIRSLNMAITGRELA